MDRTQLLQHFDTLAETPEAVAKLRAFVLDLAVRGQLVPQADKPDKDPAWQKFCRELAERVHNSESPSLFEIPDGWHWVVLDEIAEPCGQKKPDKRFSYVDVGVIDNVRGVVTTDVQVLNADEAPSRARKLVRSNSVIYSTVRPYLRNIAVIEKEFAPPAIVSTAFAVLHPKPFLSSRFLFHWLRSTPFQEVVAAKMKGVAYPAISDSEFWQCQIPVPPPSEQRRIVTKVEELLALCDELEARQTAAREHRTRLVRSALDHLTTGVRPSPVAATSARTRVSENSNPRRPHHTAAPEDGRTPDDFRRHAAFVLNTFPDLTAAPEDVPALRQAILSLAMQGKLVPQALKDEDGKMVLARIKKEKPNETSDDEKHQSPSLQRVADNETPFQLPASWAWTRLGEVACIKHGFAFKSELFTSEPTPFVLTTPGNFYEKGGFRDRGSKTKYYRGKVPQEFILQPRDLIIPMTEQAPRLLGSPAFIPNDGRTYLHNQRLGKLAFYSGSIAPEFAYWFFNSVFFRKELAKTCTGMKVRHTSPRKILRVPFPICSSAEQQRIVAKVDELLRWCDALEARLTTAQTTATHLLDATLHQILTA